MKRLLALTAICLPLYLFAQGFGSFSHDQPFLAKDSVAAPTPGEQYLYVRYDADALGLADGQYINPFTDQGVYGQHLLATNVDNRAFWTNNAGEINDEGYAYFGDANSAYQTNSTYVVAPPYHYFMVAAWPVDTTQRTIFGALTNIDPCSVSCGFATINGGIAVYNGSYMVSPVKVTNTWMLWEVCVNSNASYVRTNGVLYEYGTFATNRFSGLQMGADVKAQNLKMAYTSLYTNAFNDADAGTIASNLITRYGLPSYARNALPTWNPTTNASLLAAYDFTRLPLTNGQVITSWPDVGPKAYNLWSYSLGGGTVVFQSGMLTNWGRGFAAVRRDAAETVASALITNFTTAYPQPTTVITVMGAKIGDGQINYLYSNATNDASRQHTYIFGTFAAKMYAGTEGTSAGYYDYDPKRAYEWYHDGASSNLRSNNVVYPALSVNPGTNAKKGISLGGIISNGAIQWTTPANIWFHAVYTNTLSATERSNIYYYLTDYYKLNMISTGE